MAQKCSSRISFSADGSFCMDMKHFLATSEHDFVNRRSRVAQALSTPTTCGREIRTATRQRAALSCCVARLRPPPSPTARGRASTPSTRASRPSAPAAPTSSPSTASTRRSCARTSSARRCSAATPSTWTWGPWRRYATIPPQVHTSAASPLS
eukprot:324529-Pleurochrysis_carterae.AAC.1